MSEEADMGLSVQNRLLIWLLLALLPIIISAWLISGMMSQRLSDEAASELQNLVQLESARITSEVASIEIDSAAIASDDSLVRLLEMGESVDLVDGNAVAQAIVQTGRNSGLALEEVRIVNRAGETLAQSDGYGSQRDAASLASDAMDGRRSISGGAFQRQGSEFQEGRFGMVSPIVSDSGEVLGAVLFEYRLDRILELTRQHETYRDTSEAFVVQPEGDGGEVISTRRFDRDSAFDSTVDSTELTPSLASLDASAPVVVRLTDYRGVDTLAGVTTIDGTGWGLVIKVDAADALSLARWITSAINLALIATAGLLLLGWLFNIRPIGARLRRTADAADRVSAGQYETPIGDESVDEIGALARSIDRLAKDLGADIAAREKVEGQLRFRATHDRLTGLVNREHAATLLEQLMPDDVFTLLFVDLDGFKEVNDTYGHTVGDEVIAAVAGRLAARLPPAVIVTRWGGDEFLVIAPETDAADAGKLVLQAQAAFTQPFATQVGTHTLGASLGSASSGDGREATELLAEADEQMFKMKHHRVASKKIDPGAIRLVESALSEDRVEAFFQPVVQLDEAGTVHLAGAEALVRIRGTDGSIVSPAEFLPALGAGELSAAVDTRVMEKSFAATAIWSSEGIVPESFHIALNLGPASIRDPLLFARFTDAMVRAGLDPRQVTVEIPETVDVISSELVEEFRSLGVLLAIDDVGTQFSNLERMVDTNADIAKIDRRWIPNLATADSSKAEILGGLVDQCRTLGLSIIAEGIETTEQLEMLRALGVDVFQGFLFGKPVSGDEFRATWCGAENVSGSSSVVV